MNSNVPGRSVFIHQVVDYAGTRRLAFPGGILPLWAGLITFLAFSLPAADTPPPAPAPSANFADLPPAEFLARVRAAPREECWVKMSGALEHRRRDRETVTVPLYLRWDPGQVLAASAALNRDLSLILTWGRVTQPTHEDQLDVPDVENVTLL